MKSDSDKGVSMQHNWVNFECEVYEQVKKAIARHQLMLDPNCATVYRKRPYYSKDREKDIIFDVVVETFTKSGLTPSLIWIWECKDYPTRKVGVDEIEEFSCKLQQIGLGSVKGTVVTRVGFEASAEAVAKSQRIGLAVLQKRIECGNTL